MRDAARRRSADEQEREFLRQVPEIVIFSNCLGLIQELFAAENAHNARELDGRVFRKRMSALLSKLTRTADATQRFDVVLPVLGWGEFSTSFWRWFNWWRSYTATLTRAQIEEIELLARQRSPAVNEHRPQGDWRDYNPTPMFLVEPVSA